ncbi:MAG TPA: cytochrome c biogenesis protein CcsA [Acidimicrobiales bacterium]|nr:cytochrome c biogenesis protein CcsA [Acidimicrobiales bacterium]
MTRTPTTTGTPATRALGLLGIAGTALLVVLGLFATAEDQVQGDAVRPIYVHVPSAWVAYLAFGTTALCSALFLWKRTRSLTLDRFAGAAAEVGVLFTGLALLTGMLWGRITWGVFWTWDARLTSTSLLFVLFLGYLALRRLPAAPEVRAKRAAVAGLVAFIDVPIVHMSVRWWNTLHQDPTILRSDPEIEGLMLFTVIFGVAVFSVLFAWMLLHRQRQLWLEDHQLATDVDEAIAERRAAAVAATSGAAR